MENTNMPKADGKSLDLIQENLEQLKQIFPEVIKEGKVDFEALHDLLGNYADTAEERFCLNWAGKANARREAQKRSTGTLRPCPEDSLDWDTTENLYIEGDNLEVLKLLQKSYHSRVKMIYIDPPYNTGKDFVYKDNYTDNMQNYLELTGQDKKLSTNTESDGRYHSNWLNMMYPRLKLARNLLTDDGVIFISIDDNEVANLRKICDEIFGEENFVAQIIIASNSSKNNSRYFSVTHEYVLCYTKNKQYPREAWLVSRTNYNEYLNRVSALTKSELTNEDIRKELLALTKYPRFYEYDHYTYVDKRGVFRASDLTAPSSKNFYDVIHPITKKVCKTGIRGWAYSPDAMQKLIEDDRILWGENEEIMPQLKNYLFENKKNLPKSVLFFDSQSSTKWLKAEFIPFDFAKSTDLIKYLFETSTQNNDVILDFFSGSATTAHAVMQLNAEDGGKRKYICVQIPEPTPEGSEARKAGYTTIPEIAKERIRRAGKKILEEQKAKAEKEGGLFAEEPQKLDIGFKVFKLDSSNINAWDSNPDNLETALNNSLFNIKDDRSEDDLLYEILIKYGIELTETINRHTIDGKTVYEMGAGSLIVCLADNLSSAVAEGIGKLYEEVRPEGVEGNCRVVFKDSGFNGSDEVKTNTMLILKQHGILNVASV